MARIPKPRRHRRSSFTLYSELRRQGRRDRRLDGQALVNQASLQTSRITAAVNTNVELLGQTLAEDLKKLDARIERLKRQVATAQAHHSKAAADLASAEAQTTRPGAAKVSSSGSVDEPAEAA